MKWKLLLIISVLPLFGGEIDQRVEVLEKEMKEIRLETKAECGGEFERGWIGGKVFGDILYWHAKVGGTEYVYRLLNDDGRVESQSFDWDFGYRVGVGIFLPIVKWEVSGSFTHFGTKDTEGRGVIPPSLFINLKGGMLVSSQDAVSSYEIGCDALSVELKQGSFLSRVLGINFSLGAKQTWIEQVQKVTYRTGGEDLLRVKDRCRFQGLGPQFGVMAHVHLFSGVSLLGGAKGSLLYGHFEVKHEESSVGTKGNIHLFSPNLFFSLGIEKDISFKSVRLILALFYEADYYWRQNQAVEIEGMRGSRFQLIRYSDDVIFYGATLRVGMEF
ncbi:MAG: hypothetical protein KDK76_03390 [Chlamydiia bacterium]|nr:hypothetical protein [Chlamydiia bacterium]